MLSTIACLALLLTDLHGDPLPAGARVRMGTVRFRQGAQVGFLAFTPDGQSVLSSSGDGTLWLWDRATGRERRRFEANVRGNSSVAFTSDGRAFAVVGLDGTLQVRDLVTGKELRKL